VEELCDQMVRAVREFYSEDPQTSEYFPRIISEGHTKRLFRLLANTLGGDEDSYDLENLEGKVDVRDFVPEGELSKLLVGGRFDFSDKYVEPTIVKDVSLDDDIMTEEIFGPILPVMTFSSSSEIVSTVSRAPAMHTDENVLGNPLALYVFSDKSYSAIKEEFLDKIPSGDVVVNDTIIHVASHLLPFGGTRTSGLGYYHGKFSFDQFSHKRSVVVKDTTSILDLVIRYPPYNKISIGTFKKLLGLPMLPHPRVLLNWFIKFILMALVFVAIFYALVASNKITLNF
jgi:aldehyde dehydrogenase (NAD+)